MHAFLLPPLCLQVYCSKAKRKVLALLDLPQSDMELLTDEPAEAGLHVAAAMGMRHESLVKYITPEGPWKQVVGVRPTGGLSLCTASDEVGLRVLHGTAAAVACVLCGVSIVTGPSWPWCPHNDIRSVPAHRALHQQCPLAEVWLCCMCYRPTHCCLQVPRFQHCCACR